MLHNKISKDQMMVYIFAKGKCIFTVVVNNPFYEF